MALRSEMDQYLTSIMQPQNYVDYSPNGLQVQGKEEVHVLVSGVSACQALLDQAIACQADVILVHHGYFWRSEPVEVTGIKYQRLSTLLTHNINLFAYHIPLDANTIFGNNVQLAKHLKLPLIGPLSSHKEDALILHGEYKEPISLEALGACIETGLQRAPLIIAGGDHPIKRIAWCTGAGQEFFAKAIDAGMDCFITGEVSEYCVHMAREAKVHFISAGHHATERYGVKALGDHLAEAFDIKHQFIDIDSPV
jgi:dinuclear metal center YbgI/SA1388 family protein